MGLDQYGYAIKEGDKRELMYWRKHPNLHGFMEELWNHKDRPMADPETGDEVEADDVGHARVVHVHHAEHQVGLRESVLRE